MDTIYYFDMDDTLMELGDRIGVIVRSPGKKVKRYTSSELVDKIKQPGEKYDWKEYRSAEVFSKSARPMVPVIKKLKQVSKKAKVEILTARGDFDNQELFAATMAKNGIDIEKIHVRRVGNMRYPGNTAERKARFVSHAINKYNYREVHLYDDSENNLNAFINLKQVYPGVKFHAYHVTNEQGQIKIRKHR